MVFLMSRRKSEAQKVAEGTARKDRKRVVKLEPTVTTVRPADHLTKDQKAMFENIVRKLPEASVFRQIDSFLLSAFVIELEVYFSMNKKLQDSDGYVTRMINGSQDMDVVSKEYQVMQKSLANIISLSKQLGFDPKTRLQMIELFEEKTEEEDPFA